MKLYKHDPKTWGLDLPYYNQEKLDKEGNKILWGLSQKKFYHSLPEEVKYQNDIPDEPIRDKTDANYDQNLVTEFDEKVQTLFDSKCIEIIQGILRNKPKILNPHISFEWLLPFTRDYLRAAVATVLQHAIRNSWSEVTKAHGFSTPQLTMSTDLTSWISNSDMLGTNAQSYIQNSRIDLYSIIGDDFNGQLSGHTATGRIKLHTWDNSTLGASLGNFDTFQKGIDFLTINAVGVEKYDYMNILIDNSEQRWRYEGGGDLLSQDNWDRKDILPIAGKRYLTYRSLILTGEKGKDGLDGISAADIINVKLSVNGQEIIFTIKGGKEFRSPFIGSPPVVDTVYGFADIDKARRNVLYIVSNMSGAITDRGYAFPDFEPGTVTINKDGTISSQRLPDGIWKELDDLEKKLIDEQKTQNDKIDNIENVIIDNQKFIRENIEDIDLLKGDYRDYRTEDELFNALKKDSRTIGDIIFIRHGAFVQKVKIVAATFNSYVFSYEKDYAPANVGGEKQRLSRYLITITAGVLTLVKDGSLFTPTHTNIYSEEPAIFPEHVIRLKEFKVISDLAKANNIAILGFQGGAIELTGSSFNENLAYLAEQYAKLPVPNGYTNWLTAINTEMKLDPLFDKATGSILTTPAGTYFKTNIVDKIVAGLTDSLTVLDITFKGVEPDGTLNPNKDQIEGHSPKGTDIKSLILAFSALTLYETNDTDIQLQAKLDLVAGGRSVLRIDNIIRSISIGTTSKFEDGTLVNTQKSAGYSKKQIDDYRKARELAEKQEDATNAKKDLVNVEDIAHKGLLFGLDEVTGRAKWYDIKDFKIFKEFVKNIEFDASLMTSTQALAANPAVDNPKTILLIKNATNQNELTFSQTGLFYISDSSGKWTLLNPKSSSQGTPAFSTITDSRNHVGINTTSWTELNGTIGYREVIFSDDDFYYIDNNTPHIIESLIDFKKFKVWIGHPPRYKDRDNLIAQIPGAVLKNPHIRLNLVLITAYRSINLVSAGGIKDGEISNQLNEIVAHYYDPTDTKTNALVAKGYIKSQLNAIIWKDVVIDTATLSGTPTEIPKSSNPNTYTLLTTMKLYATKNALGLVTLYYRDKNAYDPHGEDGTIFIPIEFRIEEAVENHIDTKSNDLTAVKASITHLSDMLGLSDPKKMDDGIVQDMIDTPITPYNDSMEDTVVDDMINTPI